MPPPKWTTDEQWTWLNARLSRWREAQKLGRTAAFLVNTYNAWAQEWSDRTLLFGEKDPLTVEEETQLGVAVKARQKKLRIWFQNHGNRRGGGEDVKPDVVLPKAKSTRALQEIELYSKRYYDMKVKPVVEQEIEKQKRELGLVKLSPVERLQIVRRYTRELFEKESEDVQQEIKHAAIEEKAWLHALTTACKSGTPVQDEERSPEVYQHAIDNAPAMIDRVLAPIRAMTGGVMTVLWSGPMPEDGGAIGSFAVHQGQNASGHNFAQATPNFSEAFVHPHVQFAKAVFPRETRHRRALPAAVTGLNMDASQSVKQNFSGPSKGSDALTEPSTASAPKAASAPVEVPGSSSAAISTSVPGSPSRARAGSSASSCSNATSPPTSPIPSRSPSRASSTSPVAPALPIESQKGLVALPDDDISTAAQTAVDTILVMPDIQLSNAQAMDTTITHALPTFTDIPNSTASLQSVGENTVDLTGGGLQFGNPPFYAPFPGMQNAMNGFTFPQGSYGIDAFGNMLPMPPFLYPQLPAHAAATSAGPEFSHQGAFDFGMGMFWPPGPDVNEQDQASLPPCGQPGNTLLGTPFATTTEDIPAQPAEPSDSGGVATSTDAAIPPPLPARDRSSRIRRAPPPRDKTPELRYKVQRDQDPSQPRRKKAKVAV